MVPFLRMDVQSLECHLWKRLFLSVGWLGCICRKAADQVNGSVSGLSVSFH